MSAPTMTGSGAALAERLAPLLARDSEETGWVGHLLFGGIGAILDAGASLRLVTEDSPRYPGWAIIASPEDAPVEWLPFQADLYGVTLIKGIVERAQRDQIAELPPQQRGTTAAIVAGARSTLTGARAVRVLERPGGDAYALTLITRTAETPDPAAFGKAARTQKPGGLILTAEVSDAPLLFEYTRLLSAVTVPLADATLADVT